MSCFIMMDVLFYMAHIEFAIKLLSHRYLKLSVAKFSPPIYFYCVEFDFSNVTAKDPRGYELASMKDCVDIV